MLDICWDLELGSPKKEAPFQQSCFQTLLLHSHPSQLFTMKCTQVCDCIGQICHWQEFCAVTIAIVEGILDCIGGVQVRTSLLHDWPAVAEWGLLGGRLVCFWWQKAVMLWVTALIWVLLTLLTSNESACSKMHGLVEVLPLLFFHELLCDQDAKLTFPAFSSFGFLLGIVQIADCKNP